MVGGDAPEGEEVVIGVLEQLGDTRKRPAERLEGRADEFVTDLARVGVEDRPQRRAEHRLLLAAGMGLGAIQSLSCPQRQLPRTCWTPDQPGLRT